MGGSHRVFVVDGSSGFFFRLSHNSQLIDLIPACIEFIICFDFRFDHFIGNGNRAVEITVHVLIISPRCEIGGFFSSSDT